MNKETKKSIFKALIQKRISKDEAKILLQLEPKDLIFRSEFDFSNLIEPICSDDQLLIQLLEKAKIEFIHIKRIKIS